MNGPRLKTKKVTAGLEPNVATMARLAAGGICSVRPRGRHNQSGEKTGCERDFDDNAEACCSVRVGVEACCTHRRRRVPGVPGSVGEEADGEWIDYLSKTDIPNASKAKTSPK